MCDTVADAQQQHKRQRSLSDWMVSSPSLPLAAAARTLLPPPIAGEIKRKTSGSLPHRKLFLFFVSQSSDEAQPTCHLMTFCIDFFPQLCDMWKHFSDSKAKYYYYENVQFCNKKEMTKYKPKQRKYLNENTHWTLPSHCLNFKLRKYIFLTYLYLSISMWIYARSQVELSSNKLQVLFVCMRDKFKKFFLSTYQKQRASRIIHK